MNSISESVTDSSWPQKCKNCSIMTKILTFLCTQLTGTECNSYHKIIQH